MRKKATIMKTLISGLLALALACPQPSRGGARHCEESPALAGDDEAIPTITIHDSEIASVAPLPRNDISTLAPPSKFQKGGRGSTATRAVRSMPAPVVPPLHSFGWLDFAPREGEFLDTATSELIGIICDPSLENGSYHSNRLRFAGAELIRRGKEAAQLLIARFQSRTSDGRTPYAFTVPDKLAVEALAKIGLQMPDDPIADEIFPIMTCAMKEFERGTWDIEPDAHRYNHLNKVFDIYFPAALRGRPILVTVLLDESRDEKTPFTAESMEKIAGYAAEALAVQPALMLSLADALGTAGSETTAGFQGAILARTLTQRGGLRLGPERFSAIVNKMFAMKENWAKAQLAAVAAQTLPYERKLDMGEAVLKGLIQEMGLQGEDGCKKYYDDILTTALSRYPSHLNLLIDAAAGDQPALGETLDRILVKKPSLLLDEQQVESLVTRLRRPMGKELTPMCLSD